jgi:hypothetical protein
MVNMKKIAIISAGLLMFGCVADNGDDGIGSAEQAATGEQGMHGAPEHLQLARGYSRPSGGAGSNPLMTWHGGDILTANKTEAIFWGDWSNPGDVITGLDSFFTGFGGSAYAKASTEYTGANGQVTAGSTYLGHVMDPSAAPNHAINTKTAVAEACKVTGNAPDPNALYLLYTSTGAGNVSYCAWHSWGKCGNGAPIQVAYMPWLEGIAGCDPGDTLTSHSEALASLANVTAHELSETITDPRGAGWFDAGGNENGDKCAWAFNGTTKFGNGEYWFLQGEWSNAAYTAGTGYPNRSGQPGCLPR